MAQLNNTFNTNINADGNTFNNIPANANSSGLRLDKDGNPYLFLEINIRNKDGVEVKTGLSCNVVYCFNTEVYGNADVQASVKGFREQIAGIGDMLTEPGQSVELESSAFVLRLVRPNNGNNNSSDMQQRIAAEKQFFANAIAVKR